MTLLFLRNLIFIVLQPGIVAGYIPYLIVRDEWSVRFLRWEFLHYLGIIVFMIGLIIMLHCVYQFAVEGRGTLSPVDPTQHLVINGLYRFTRNPMYLGVITMLIGEAIFTWSNWLWIYSFLVFIGFNLFILLVEEPRLKKDFGAEYEQYCQEVRRWI